MKTYEVKYADGWTMRVAAKNEDAATAKGEKYNKYSQAFTVAVAVIDHRAERENAFHSNAFDFGNNGPCR